MTAHREFTVFTRQLDIFTTSLVITLSGEKARIKLSKTLFDIQLQTIHSIVKLKTAVPSDNIFVSLHLILRKQLL